MDKFLAYRSRVYTLLQLQLHCAPYPRPRLQACMRHGRQILYSDMKDPETYKHTLMQSRL